MSGRKRSRPTKSTATGTWKPRKRVKLALPVRNIGWRTGGFRSVPGTRGELKWIDVINSSSFAATASVQLINGLAAGTQSTQRIGRKIVMKSLLVKFTLGCGTAGATPFRGKLKASIVYDSQTNASAPVSTDIYLNATANSPMNLDNRGRFKVLWKRNWYLDQSGGMGASGCDTSKVCNLPVIFNSGSAGTVADIATGGVFLVLQSLNANTSVTPTNYPDYAFTTRIRFADD